MSKHVPLEELSAYVDGEAADAEAIRAHVQRCEECARRQVELSKISSHLKALSEPEPRAGFAEGVARAIRDSGARGQRRPLRVAVPLAAVAVLAVATLFALSYRGTVEPRETPVIASLPVQESDESLLAELEKRLASDPDPDSILMDPYLEDGDGVEPSDEDMLLALASADWFDDLAAEWNGEDLESALTGLDQDETETFVLLLNEYAQEG